MALTDDLFESIDTIISARLGNLPYDLTIECEVLGQRDKTSYLMSYQNAGFIAYTTDENTVYKKGDVVYVKIPQGDFKEDKFITGKKQLNEIKKVKGLPFLNFLKGNNFFTQGERTREYSIKINDSIKESVIKTFYPTSGSVYAGYTRLGIKCSFNSNITNEMASGEYGIRIRLNGYDQTKTYLPASEASRKDSPVLAIYELDLFTDSMIGANHYNTLGYVNQELVFDITNFAITSISVLLYQDDNFVTIDGDRLTERRISVSNLQLYLGYDANVYTSTSKPYAILYTEDGLLYDTNILRKKIQVRFIQRATEDLGYTIITSYITNHLYTFYWEKYNIYANENISNLSGLPLYETLEITDNTLTNKSISLNVDLPSARNRIYAGFVFVVQGTGIRSADKFISNELYFTNAAYLANSEVVDLVLGLLADPKESEDDILNYNGKYFIYGQDSHATDLIAVAKMHYLSITYTSISESDDIQGLLPGDKISWKIPATSTMILPASTDEIETAILNINNEKTFYTYDLTLTESSIHGQDRIFRLPYYINEYYSPAYTNNKIEISLNRKGALFNTSCELLFGTSGSLGSEYSLRIILKLGKKLIYTIPITGDAASQGLDIIAEVEAYDYNNKIIKNLEGVNWSLITKFDNSPISINNQSNTSSTCLLHFNLQAGIMAYITNPTILRARIQRGGNDIFGYLPIAVCTGIISNDANGTTLLVYDITGKKPTFTKTSFQLKNNKEDELKWEVYPQEEEGKELTWRPFLNDKNELAGPSIYVKNSSIAYYSLVAYNKDTELPIWASPIYMFLHKYPNATDYPEMNQVHWGGINNNNYTVESTVAGRINTKIDQNDQKEYVSGIFLGNVKDTSNTANTARLGLFAFHDNTLFAEINEDGYVFLDGITEDNTESAGIIIKDALITSSTITDSTIVTSTANYAREAIKATNDSEDNKISDTYLKLSGGTMSGAVKWKDNTALPTMTSTPTYMFVLDSNNNNNITKKIKLLDITVGHASTATTANNYNTSTGNIKTTLDNLLSLINSLKTRIENLENRT